MAEPYSATIGQAWTAVAGEGSATVTPNAGPGALLWAVATGTPEATLIGGECKRNEDKSFGGIAAGQNLWLRAPSGNYKVTVHPDVRPATVPTL